jgi:hypothetical protein
MSSITVEHRPKVARPGVATQLAALWLALSERLRQAAASRRARRQREDRAAEAAALRAYAQRLVEQDPHFAADLMAAADRHEVAE